MRRKRDEWKDNEKWSFMKWSLVKITLKHNLGLFILSFKPWTLTYITYLKSPFWSNVDTWTEESLPWNFFCNQQGCCLFSSAKILDKSFTCSGWNFKCIIGQWKMKSDEKKRKNKNGNKEQDSRVKTRKGGLEQK